MNCAHRCDREASRQPEKIPKTGLSCENDAEALRVRQWSYPVGVPRKMSSPHLLIVVHEVK